MHIVIVLLVLILLALLGVPVLLIAGGLAGGLLGGLILLVTEYWPLILFGLAAVVVYVMVYVMRPAPDPLSPESPDARRRQLREYRVVHKNLDTEIRALENRRSTEINARKLADVDRKLRELRKRQGRIKRAIRDSGSPQS